MVISIHWIFHNSPIFYTIKTLPQDCNEGYHEYQNRISFKLWFWSTFLKIFRNFHCTAKSFLSFTKCYIAPYRNYGTTLVRDLLTDAMYINPNFANFWPWYAFACSLPGRQNLKTLNSPTKSKRLCKSIPLETPYTDHPDEIVISFPQRHIVQYKIIVLNHFTVESAMWI